MSKIQINEFLQTKIRSRAKSLDNNNSLYINYDTFPTKKLHYFKTPGNILIYENLFYPYNNIDFNITDIGVPFWEINYNRDKYKIKEIALPKINHNVKYKLLYAINSNNTNEYDPVYIVTDKDNPINSSIPLIIFIETKVNVPD